MARVLALDLNGSPTRWISFEEAITYQAKKWLAGQLVILLQFLKVVIID